MTDALSDLAHAEENEQMLRHDAMMGDDQAEFSRSGVATTT
jgi:hypothetical protein